MLPAAALNVQPGDAVLDLCSAPGSKRLGARKRAGFRQWGVSHRLGIRSRAPVILRFLVLQPKTAKMGILNQK